MSANAASAASLKARMSAVYLTAARVYLAPAAELRGVKSADELSCSRRGLIGRLGRVTRRRLEVDAFCRGGTLDVASRGHGGAAAAAVAAVASVASVASKEKQEHKESRDTTHALEFTDRRRVVLGAGDALVHGITPHFLGHFDGQQTRYFCQKRRTCQ